MKKNEVVKLLQEIAKSHGLELTKNDIFAILDSIDDLIVEIFNREEKANIGNAIKVEVKEYSSKSGKTALPGQETVEWSIPACKKVNIKTVKSFADKHKIIL